MKMTKKFFAIMLTMALVFTSVPMVSFGAQKFVDPNENLPYAPTIKSAQTSKVKKSKKYSLTITLESMSSCTGYRLFRVDKNGVEKKVKDFSYKSVKKAKKKIVYKDKKSKVCNQTFVLKSYNTFYKYKKGKTAGWVKTKPKKKYWYKKQTTSTFSIEQNNKTADTESDKKEETPGGDAPAGGGGGGGAPAGPPAINTGGGQGNADITNPPSDGKQDLPTFGGYDPNLETVPL